MDREIRDGSQSEGLPRTRLERTRAALRAARGGDRVVFDRLFDEGFDAVYTLGWELTGVRIQTERLTENVLVGVADALLDPEIHLLWPGCDYVVVPTQLDL